MVKVLDISAEFHEKRTWFSRNHKERHEQTNKQTNKQAGVGDNAERRAVSLRQPSFLFIRD